MKTRFLLPLWLAVCTLFVYGCAPELAGEYVDPTIPEGEQGWFYTTVKPDYVFA